LKPFGESPSKNAFLQKDMLRELRDKKMRSHYRCSLVKR